MSAIECPRRRESCQGAVRGLSLEGEAPAEPLSLEGEAPAEPRPKAATEQAPLPSPTFRPTGSAGASPSRLSPRRAEVRP